MTDFPGFVTPTFFNSSSLLLYLLTLNSSAKTPFDKMKSAGGGFFGRTPDSAPATPTMMQQPPQVPPQAPPQPQTGLPPGEPSPQQDGQMLDALMSKMQGGKNV